MHADYSMGCGNRLGEQAEPESSPKTVYQESPCAKFKISVLPRMLCKRLRATMRVSAREPFPWLSVSLIAKKDMQVQP